MRRVNKIFWTSANVFFSLVSRENEMFWIFIYSDSTSSRARKGRNQFDFVGGRRRLQRAVCRWDVEPKNNIDFFESSKKIVTWSLTARRVWSSQNKNFNSASSTRRCRKSQSKSTMIFHLQKKKSEWAAPSRKQNRLFITFLRLVINCWVGRSGDWRSKSINFDRVTMRQRANKYELKPLLLLFLAQSIAIHAQFWVGSVYNDARLKNCKTNLIFTKQNKNHRQRLVTRKFLMHQMRE